MVRSIRGTYRGDTVKFDSIFFAGGMTCLDFCNTVEHLHTPPGYDFFSDRETIIEWGQAAGILPAATKDLRNKDQRIFKKALESRDLLIRLLTPLSQSESPKDADVKLFNKRLREASAHVILRKTGDDYELALEAHDPVERVTYEAIRSAADLLLRQEKGRVRQCSECGWLFYDATRNRSRRWCDMGTCGNRAKARRHYERVRQEKIQTG